MSPVSLPKDDQVANAVLTHESDFYGAFKNAGPLNGGTAPGAGHQRTPKARKRPSIRSSR